MRRLVSFVLKYTEGIGHRRERHPWWKKCRGTDMALVAHKSLCNCKFFGVTGTQVRVGGGWKMRQRAGSRKAGGA